MQNLRSSRLLLAVTALFFCALVNKVSGQTHTAKYISTGPNSNGFYEYLPQGYDPNGTQTYPLILFVHGLGECGAGTPVDLPKMLWAGIPQAINAGNFPSSLTVNGQTHKFIVISPQFMYWPGGGDIDMAINYAVSHYKVNLSRVYLTGLSMGGGATWEYVGAGGNYTNRIAAAAPICGASWPEYTRARNIAAGNLPIWAFHNDGDPTVPVFYTNDYISQINQAPAPNPLAKKTIWPYTGHDAWTNVYNCYYTENGMNVYQWMLQYQKGTPPPANNNQPPVANAGPDQIVAPGATAQLNGAGTDVDGTVSSYAWTQVSGPGQFSFNNANIPNPTVSNLTGGVYVFRLTVTDNGGTASYDDIKITVPPTLPAKVEAENYSLMYGVQNENTADLGGGQNVGWQDAGDWMEYDVNVANAGSYTANFRVAAVYSGAQFQLRKSDGTVLATVNVPATNNVQTWTTTTAQINLTTTGTQKLRIYTTIAGGGWNFNWMEFTGNSVPNQPPVVNAGTDQNITLPSNAVTLSGTASDPNGTIANYSWTKVGGPGAGTISTPSSASTQVSGMVQGTYTFRLTATDNAGATAYDEVTVTVNDQATTPPPSSSMKIEAESYASMSGIGTENTSDVGGGLNVGWQDNGDWMNYTVNLASAGTYTVNFRVASFFNGAQFQLKKSDGTVLTTVTVPNTGSFQTWQTVSAQVTLPAGQQTLRIYTSAANGGWNFNWWEIQGGSPSTNPPPTNPPTSTKIEAESYTAMAGIGTENTSDAGGGLNVGWQDTNDWMDYSVNLSSAGTYTVNFRVASYFSGAQFQVRKADGTVLTTVTVPNTGSFQTWQTVSAQVALAAGQQTLRIWTSAANGGWNFNWWEIQGGSSTTPPPTNPPTSTKIEAESYSSMAGIGTENTSDAGGGLNVGWQDTNDWMDYVVNASAAGTYNVNFRVASYFSGAQFQVRKADGTVLTTVTVPNTGSFQTWATVSAQITLPAGQQTLRIWTSAANGGWNFNWWEIVSATASRGTEASGSVEQVFTTTTASAAALQVFPNPVSDRFMLKVNNALTGKMKVEIYDMKGAVVKQFSVSKPAAGVSQSYLSIGDLQTGQYILKVSMNNYAETKQLIKQ